MTIHTRLKVIVPALGLVLGLGGSGVPVLAAKPGRFITDQGSGMNLGPGSGREGGGHDPDCPVTGKDSAHIFKGEPFSFNGPVLTADSSGRHGGTMALLTGTKQVFIHGLGPLWYWEEQRQAYPMEGEIVTVDGYGLAFAVYTSHLAVSLTRIDGRLIQLRNPETGWPLWGLGKWG